MMTDDSIRELIGYQSDMAKWLFASLLLVTGGSLAFIVHEDSICFPAKYCAAPWFGAGVICTMLSGYLSWWNTAKHIRLALAPDAADADDTRRAIRKLAIASTMCAALALVLATIGGVIVHHLMLSPWCLPAPRLP
jgi:hypothetical protein